MIEIKDKKNCCGCSACYAVCPKKCISMVEDVEGFLFPSIDKLNCINCGLCEKVCPILRGIRNLKSDDVIQEKAIVAVSKRDNYFMSSSSGNVFSLLAREILSNNGVVFGVKFLDDFTGVYYDYIEKESDLEKLQGSKYIQANPRKSFLNVKEFLEKERFVLFSGTPCSILGLKNFLGKEYEKLYLIDISCYSIPSPKIWRLFLGDISKKFFKNKKIENISFRKKVLENNEINSFKFVVDPNLYIKSSYSTLFGKAFMKNLINRQSCLECPAKLNGNASDMTLGDYWGVEKNFPDLNVKNGVSIIICRTQKALDFLYKIKDKLSLVNDADINIAFDNNKGLFSKKTEEPHNRAKLFREVNLGEKPISYILNKYTKDTLFYRLKRFSIRITKKIIKTFKHNER